MTMTKPGFLQSVAGISSTIGRVVFGSIATKLSPLLVNNISVALAGVAVTMIPLSKSYTSMMIASSAYGLFSCTFKSLKN